MLKTLLICHTCENKLLIKCGLNWPRGGATLEFYILNPFLTKIPSSIYVKRFSVLSIVCSYKLIMPLVSLLQAVLSHEVHIILFINTLHVF